ncbi:MULTISPECIES: hypothetical protein [Tenacibaculum]|uniref:hypothetical protein n=1 Tax=Tenacibaculum TaxID=104267 RepID=UPI00187B9FB0|nr:MULTISPECIES: hypothetical protein [Tenacibaculum]MCD8425951.1 hypothetical protein [Tenacibaculum dicentrarchi]MBE7688957.1 hypothetical protein [Tenacibaculum finnmarkense genomovar ulcerans]MBE7693594.1 hypothetical protein [Tenacibaculum finnmarkense genomovar finnmarkense]MCD8411008.1 hypothetical protein [Tenacibaculum finnmarkense genomovar ulcerans]MCG8750480.1 hypothetical protein [Tenacibaculum finnmarkense]
MNNYIERRNIKYKEQLEKIKIVYQENKNWDTVITTVIDAPFDFDLKSNQAQEILIDYIESIYSIKIKDADQLQKITNITTKTLEELEAIILTSKYTKYYRAVELAVENGATYPEILKIMPKEYGLPDQWNKKLSSNQYGTIVRVLSFSYLIKESLGISILPSLRDISKKIKAPYSVLMDAYQLINNVG